MHGSIEFLLFGLVMCFFCSFGFTSSGNKTFDGWEMMLRRWYSLWSVFLLHFKTLSFCICELMLSGKGKHFLFLLIHTLRKESQSHLLGLRFFCFFFSQSQALSRLFIGHPHSAVYSKQDCQQHICWVHVYGSFQYVFVISLLDYICVYDSACSPKNSTR